MPDALSNGRDPRVSLHISLLIAMVVFQVLTAWGVLDLRAELKLNTAQTQAANQQRGEQLTLIETQHRSQSEGFEELTWILSRKPEERPRLAVPSSLWRKLDQADRDALSREMDREPLQQHRGSPRRRPTDG